MTPCCSRLRPTSATSAKSASSSTSKVVSHGSAAGSGEAQDRFPAVVLRRRCGNELGSTTADRQFVAREHPRVFVEQAFGIGRDRPVRAAAKNRVAREDRRGGLRSH